VLFAVTLLRIAASLGAQPAQAVSAPISHVHYDITVDSSNLTYRRLAVSMTFAVSSSKPVLLALPAWSPGHYTLLWFARRVSGFAAEARGGALRWRKVGLQTWEIQPTAAGTVTVSFRYRADTVDRAVAWTASNFAFFNGTNVFLYPVGRGFDWPATVSVSTEPTWRVVTGMKSAQRPNDFRAENYHDLVDMPFYVGRFDVDSTRTSDRWVRFALYPAGAMTTTRRDRTFEWLRRLLPTESTVFGEIPFDRYTVFLRSDSAVNGGGLEHQNSQVDEVRSARLDADLSGVYAHELFHAWNVKRLRPADMVPYRYDDAQPTTWLWVSEGVTDYYATLSLSRSGIIDSVAAYASVAIWIEDSKTHAATELSLSDASLSSWIGLLDGNDELYYPKGALTGMLLDILIRDQTSNRHSLDDVMRALYQNTYKRGRGFTDADWWGTIARVAGRNAPFVDFRRRRVDGREALPVDSILALAALRFARVVISEPRFGITTHDDSLGVTIASLEVGGAGAAAALHVGDRVISAGAVPISSSRSFNTVRAQYAGSALASIPFVIRRGSDTETVAVSLRLTSRTEMTVTPIQDSPPKAIAIRSGIFARR
jgi:predicted metalloprotease with PDZ domain